MSAAVYDVADVILEQVAKLLRDADIAQQQSTKRVWEVAANLNRNSMPSCLIRMQDEETVTINAGLIDADLEIRLELNDYGNDDELIECQLLELKRKAHLVMMKQEDLGLPGIVLFVTPLGHAAPIYARSSEYVAGNLSTAWQIRFRYNAKDRSGIKP